MDICQINLHGRDTVPKFPAGEIVTDRWLSEVIFYAEKYQILYAGASSDTFFQLALVVDSIRTINPSAKIFLVMPYVPYSRHDRKFTETDAIGIRAFASLLNSLKLDQVEIYDAHSSVTEPLINNVVHRTQSWIFSHCYSHITEKFSAVIAPDAGAAKKAEQISKRMNVPVFYATKERGEHGKILKTAAPDLSSFPTGSSFLIVDDICDGGATFIELAKAIEDNNQSFLLSLFVTHGMFSKGTDVLFEHYNKIYAAFDWTNNAEVANFGKHLLS